MADEADAWQRFQDDRDIVSYVVTLADGTSFMVKIDLGWAATITDWAGTEFTDERLAEVAATGQTNTTHTR